MRKAVAEKAVSARWQRLVAAGAGVLVGGCLAGVAPAAGAAPALPSTKYTTCPSATQFKAAARHGGTIDFGVNCSITLTAPITLKTGTTLTIEGNGYTVDLSGGGSAQLFKIEVRTSPSAD